MEKPSKSVTVTADAVHKVPANVHLHTPITTRSSALGRVEHDVFLLSLFMFRLALRCAMSSRATAATKSSASSTSAPAEPKKYNPKDWVIIGASPGNVDMMFRNHVEDTYTWYTPEGMTAEEIMQIPTAKEFFGNLAAAQWYIDDKAREKVENLAEGINDP
ncbi:hypothetical protein NMY22_g14530 [Coprinellus aureogranulatus]|nr:hypothetical protein NMY22_g14530 [Coprinellus aureogranulatus]